jgi:hypothetical protein
MKMKILLVVFLFASICAVSQYSGQGKPLRDRPENEKSIPTPPHQELARQLIEKYGVDPKHQEMIELEISMAINYRKDIPQELLQEIYSLERRK